MSIFRKFSVKKHNLPIPFTSESIPQSANDVLQRRKYLDKFEHILKRETVQLKDLPKHETEQNVYLIRLRNIEVGTYQVIIDCDEALNVRYYTRDVINDHIIEQESTFMLMNPPEHLKFALNAVPTKSTLSKMEIVIEINFPTDNVSLNYKIKPVYEQIKYQETVTLVSGSIGGEIDLEPGCYAACIRNLNNQNVIIDMELENTFKVSEKIDEKSTVYFSRRFVINSNEEQLNLKYVINKLHNDDHDDDDDNNENVDDQCSEKPAEFRFIVYRIYRLETLQIIEEREATKFLKHLEKRARFAFGNRDEDTLIAIKRDINIPGVRKLADKFLDKLKEQVLFCEKLKALVLVDSGIDFKTSFDKSLAKEKFETKSFFDQSSHYEGQITTLSKLLTQAENSARFEYKDHVYLYAKLLDSVEKSRKLLDIMEKKGQVDNEVISLLQSQFHNICGEKMTDTSLMKSLQNERRELCKKIKTHEVKSKFSALLIFWTDSIDVVDDSLLVEQLDEEKLTFWKEVWEKVKDQAERYLMLDGETPVQDMGIPTTSNSVQEISQFIVSFTLGSIGLRQIGQISHTISRLIEKRLDILHSYREFKRQLITNIINNSPGTIELMLTSLDLISQSERSRFLNIVNVLRNGNVHNIKQLLNKEELEEYSRKAPHLSEKSAELINPNTQEEEKKLETTSESAPSNSNNEDTPTAQNVQSKEEITTNISPTIATTKNDGPTASNGQWLMKLKFPVNITFASSKTQEIEPISILPSDDLSAKMNSVKAVISKYLRQISKINTSGKDLIVDEKSTKCVADQFIRKQLIPLIEALLLSGWKLPDKVLWDLFEEASEELTGVKKFVDLVNNKIKMEQITHKHEVHLKNTKFRTLFCLSINNRAFAKLLLTIFAANQKSIFSKYYQEDALILMNTKSICQDFFSSYETDKLKIKFQMETTSKKNEYTV